MNISIKMKRILNWLELYRVNGRINRVKYLSLSSISFVLFTVFILIFGPLIKDNNHQAVLLSLLFVVLAAPVVINVMCLQIRRLHDFNMRGWWVLLGFVPVVRWLWFLVTCCIPGDKGENRFGTKPQSALLSYKVTAFIYPVFFIIVSSIMNIFNLIS